MDSLLLFSAILLVFLNGFFVAAEFSLVKLRATRVRTMVKVYGLPGKILGRVHSRLDAYLSACQLGITLASLGLGWVGEPAFSRIVEPVLTFFGVDSPALLHAASLTISFSVISFLHIVVGELAPKSLAIRLSDKVGLWTSVPLYVFYWIMYPGIWVLNASANLILKWLGLSGSGEHEAHYSAEELKLILRTSRASDVFTQDEWAVLAHTLDFGDLTVADLMRPFHEAVSLSADASHADNLQRIAHQRFSRYPWLDEDGNVKGLLHVKDLLPALVDGQGVGELREYLRPALLISPDMKAVELMRRFRTGAPHFATVGIKGQAPLGFITLDNLLGALVGEIRDEFRQSHQEWIRQDDGTLLGKGSLPIFSLERALGVEIVNDEVDSVGGLVMWKLGSVPREGDRVKFERFDVVVKKMKGPRIVLVRVHPHDPVPDA